MKIKFSKSGRLADTEIIIMCETSVSSPSAAFQINDLVKKTALELARDIRNLMLKVKEQEQVARLPVAQSLADSLLKEPEMRKIRTKDSEEMKDEV